MVSGKSCRAFQPHGLAPRAHTKTPHRELLTPLKELGAAIPPCPAQGPHCPSCLHEGLHQHMDIYVLCPPHGHSRFPSQAVAPGAAGSPTASPHDSQHLCYCCMEQRIACPVDEWRAAEVKVPCKLPAALDPSCSQHVFSWCRPQWARETTGSTLWASFLPGLLSFAVLSPGPGQGPRMGQAGAESEPRIRY